MSRITCKTCRRLGESLCGREKCAFKKRPFAPGKLDSDRKHRSSVTEYGIQMKEKQKMRKSYGVSESQFKRYVTNSTAESKKAGLAQSVALYQRLERRLDNVVYRSGLAKSRALARQMVAHGHIFVNGKRINIPSHMVSANDMLIVRDGSKSSKLFATLKDNAKDVFAPKWITSDFAKLEVKVNALPIEIGDSFDITKVLEFYSR